MTGSIPDLGDPSASGADRPLVVVVDDDERLRALAALALAKHGISVLAAASAEEGLDAVRRLDPDLVVLDIVMPEMSGWEVLRQVRQASDVPLLLLSGRDSDVDKARGLDLGADDYLTKPFSFLELEARVRALLRRRRAVTAVLVEPGAIVSVAVPDAGAPESPAASPAATTAGGGGGA